MSAQPVIARSEAAPSTQMQRALDLAASVAGTTSPNPAVGAVLVREGRVAGEGAMGVQVGIQIANAGICYLL